MAWERFQEFVIHERNIGFMLDVSRMNFADEFLDAHEEKMQRALSSMSALEGGAIANPDEGRMVGHYWLRQPEIAPDPVIKGHVESAQKAIHKFIQQVHVGEIAPERGGRFEEVLLVGIGGSALGPQFVADALRKPQDRMQLHFFDNTDPDGMNRTLSEIRDISKCLCVVVSKSGGTKETRNGMKIAEAAWAAADLDFSRAAVAITGEGSNLDHYAARESWLSRFPMWDWVGGRTSEFSAVGLLPAALQGIDVQSMLSGARSMDELTRRAETRQNPAALLALMWYHAGYGKGSKDMVVLPYRDRLILFSRYLQQLVMESLGKELDLDGKTVNQGLTVYGNKGSTDQHAFVQQLREGSNTFFLTFIEVLKDRSTGWDEEIVAADQIEVEEGVTAGDFLNGFYQGTRSALHEKGRESLTITIDEISPFSIGMLVALFERAVGLYASLINVNAYHQPGVEAGKKAAGEVLELRTRVLAILRDASAPLTVDQIGAALGEDSDHEAIFKIVRYLGANKRVLILPEASVFEDRYQFC